MIRRARVLISGWSSLSGGRPSCSTTRTMAIFLSLHRVTMELVMGWKAPARVALEGQNKPMVVPTVSPLDGASPLALLSEVSLLCSNFGFPSSPVVEDSISETVMEVSPIQSIFPPSSC